MHSDNHPVDQPEDSYRYALNAVIQDGKFCNEAGNELCAELPANYHLIGHAYAIDSVIVLLASGSGESEIGRIRDCTYTTLLNELALNFSLKHQMKDVKFRIRRGCEEVLYFTDDYNPPRAINLSKLDDYYTAGVFDARKVNLFRDVIVPTITAQVNEYGGSVKLGTYNFAFRYLDEDLNPSHWVCTTPTIAVYDESINTPYTGIDGGIGIDVDPVNGLPNTSKSISLNLGNLDTRFPYYQIAVIAATSASGRPSSYLVSPETPISQSLFTYSGGVEAYTNATAEEIALPKQEIEQAAALEIANNRLLLANIKGKKIDYAELQRAASKIYTNYQILEVDAKDQTIPGNAKNPNTYYEKMSEMGGEVRAYGIVYVFEGGYESPACHIPGRPANVNPLDGSCTLITGDNTLIPAPEIASQWDTSPISTWTPDMRHIFNDPADYDGSLKRYQVYNTATKFNTPSSGLMGYYQTESAIYPDIVDCNGESIWGIDACGNQLAGQNIRHHRMPDRQLQPQYNYATDKIRLIGVTFNNIEYPDTRIVGHYIVAAERTEDNKTVLDKGVAFRYNDCSDLKAFSYMGGTISNDPMQFIATPRFFYNNELLGGYIKAEADLGVSRSHNATDIKKLTGVGQDDIYFGLRTITCTSGQTNIPQRNYAVQRYMKLGAMSKDVLDGDAIGNMSMTNNVNLYKTYETIPQHSYVSVCLFRDVYTNLFNLKYYKIHADVLTPQTFRKSSTVFGGDTFISEFKILDYKIRDINEGLWKNLAIIGSIIVGLVATVVTAGLAAPAAVATVVVATAAAAAFIGITATTVAAHIKAIKDGIYEECLEDEDIDQAVADEFGLLDGLDKKVILAIEYFKGLWVESSINLDLRHSNNDDCGTYYQGGDFFNFIQPKLTYYNEEENEFQVKPVFCPQIYLYNKDYSRQDRQKAYFSLPVSFDYCSGCAEEFPNRVIWSEVSLDEQQSDAFRVFLANNAQDIPGRYGPITNLIKKGEKLYITTTDMLYYAPENLQERINSDLVTYIGTGDYLGIPPREVVDSELGSVGCMDSISPINTPFGTVILDVKDGIVFLLASSLEPISMSGMDSFFRSELALRSSQPINPAHPHGVGYMTYYDPEERRLIITKKDFVPNTRIVETPYGGSGLYYHPNGYWYFNTGNTLNLVDIRNANYFTNYSWTVSYSLTDKKWISHHSYIPDYAFYTKQNFFTSINSEVWSHNADGVYNKYYGISYPHILDMVDVAGQTVKWQYAELHTEAEKGDVEQRYVTFNKAWFYNSRQSSGLQLLRPVSSGADHLIDASKDEFGVIKIDKRERTWNISDLRDYVTNYGVPVSSSDWAAIGSAYPVDKIPNPLSTTASKNWYDIEGFRDKYLNARFYFELNDVRLLTNFVTFYKIQSPR